MEEGAGEKEMVSSVNVLKDTLVNAVKTVRNYKSISCIKYSKLSYCRILCTASHFLCMTWISRLVITPICLVSVQRSSRPSRSIVSVTYPRPRRTASP